MATSSMLGVLLLLFFTQLGSSLFTKETNVAAGSRIEMEANGRNYSVFRAAVGIAEADQECLNQGKHLVDFNEEGEYLAIQAALFEAGLERSWYWTAARKDAKKQVWYWETTGETITDYFWLPGEPSNDTSNDYCMRFDVSVGGWLDDPCDTNFLVGYICE
ncbi:C-type lectin domain family 4 member K-like [Neocloeon triangulifer]|uniref:C-type lectin domain family 4 member K-like n=1 Tax=Neocloeon triangulifer TaxID=2078957 RepID=UPI00286F8629|nr:C-type lectin domain family 4 member K-like [Neocloeon triangulifer]